MVSSALGQEGKTTVASQLAVSFARSGRRTLLVDGDIRNPQQHVVLGMPMGQGLCDLLRSDVTLDDVVKPTPAEGLWFLGAGYRDLATDQYMASAVMSKLFAELRDRFDLIVLDTGPVLTSPDAMLLGQHADATVISLRRDVSRLPKVLEACDRLRSVGVHIAGAVLNGASADVRESELSLPEPSGSSKDPQLERA
jgi:capsular exopolysaccharide synthesis family protein